MATSRADARALLNLAADETENPNGVAIEVESFAAAVVLRAALNSARAAERKENAQLHDPDHPLHNRSPWEHLTVRIKSHPRHPHQGCGRTCPAALVPHMVHITSSEAAILDLKLVDPETGERLDVDLGDLREIYS